MAAEWRTVVAGARVNLSAEESVGKVKVDLGEGGGVMEKTIEGRTKGRHAEPSLPPHGPGRAAAPRLIPVEPTCWP